MALYKLSYKDCERINSLSKRLSNGCERFTASYFCQRGEEEGEKTREGYIMIVWIHYYYRLNCLFHAVLPSAPAYSGNFGCA